MALRATVYRAKLDIADMDRNYYGSHSLTLAREPSETDERLMVRLLAFALDADEALSFTSDMSETEEPALWKRDLEGRIELWIEVGLPDPRRLRKAAGRAKRVKLYLYHGRQAALWLEEHRAELATFRNLEILELPAEEVGALAALADKTMDLQVSIQEGQVTFAHEGGIVIIEARRPL